MSEFVEVSGQSKIVKYTELAAKMKELKLESVLAVQGTYLGNHEGQYGRLNDFMTPNGKVTLPGAGQLDWHLDNSVQVGQEVQVQYLGKEIMEKGKYKGKEVNSFKVLAKPMASTQKPAVDDGTPEWMK